MSLVCPDTVTVQPASLCGDVLVEGRGERWRDAALLNGRGASVPLGFFQYWNLVAGVPFAGGADLTLPRLPSGGHRLCVGSGARACAQVWAVAGATVAVDLPER